jgi:hypothetical protein
MIETTISLLDVADLCRMAGWGMIYCAIKALGIL